MNLYFDIWDSRGTVLYVQLLQLCIVLQVYGDILERPCISHPSEEMVDCLRQIGELSEKHNSVVKNVVSLAESQQEIVGELARIEEALPQKVTKEELHIPDDLQDQLGMLKQGL